MIPECRLSGFTAEIITRVLGLRVKFGTQKWIMLQNLNTTIASQKAGVALNRTEVFAYRLRDLEILDLRLLFG